MVKGKRWKKGQSSSSNPSTKKYREQAKVSRNFFNFGMPSQNESSSLTSKALAQLDSLSLNNNNINNDRMETKSLMSDSDSIGSFSSWASNWSECTNATFNKIHKHWRSNSALHKEILATLAAITEVIKENEGKGTEVEYFAALMTGLEPVKDNEETTTAFLYLISLAIKKVPENVLKAKFQELLASFSGILDKYSDTANNPILIKSCLICLCWLLKSQEAKSWMHNKQTIETYLKILNYVDHRKPKIRRFSKEAIVLIINSCNSKSSTDVYQFVTSVTAEYCLNAITNGPNPADEQQEPNSKQQSKANNNDSSNKTILNVLALIRHIIIHFDQEHLKATCECLLRLMTLKDMIISESCFQAFYHLFNSIVNQMTPELNAQLINALYDYQPNENNPQLVIGWLAVLESAIKCLNRSNKQLCLSHLPYLIQRFMQTYASTLKQVHTATTKCMMTVLEQCVQTNTELLVDDLKNATDLNKSLLQRMFTHIEAGLSYQYHNAWAHIMQILGCAFTSFKSVDTFPVVDKCIHSLANLRESEQFDYKKEADMALGRAIRTYGPKLIIDCVKLHITGDETSYEYPRSWMLPLLKDNIQRTELGYFVKKLLPLAKKLREKSELFKQQRREIEVKIFDNLQNQFWSLLPGFCYYPVDFAESFKNFAKTLGETLEKCPDLRTHALKSIRTLIISNSDENKTMMGKFAKNYLPIMFNLYTTDMKMEDSSRQSLLDTIRLYIRIADNEIVNVYLQQAVKNYENFSRQYQESLKASNNNSTDANNNSTAVKPKVQFDFNKCDSDAAPKIADNDALKPFLFAKYTFLDLIGVLVKYSNESNVPVVHNLAQSGIINQSADKTVQKKSYKILDSLLECGQEANEKVREYIETNFEKIAQTLVKTLSSCNAAAKVPRLKCLLALMNYVKKSEHKLLIRQTLPEVILCIKEVNQKSRDASFSLLNRMLRLWQNLAAQSTPPVNEAESLNEFMRLVMVGLGGSTNMVSCTCLALASLSYEFKENLSGSIIGDLIETSCLLVRTDQKEIIISSLNLLKVMCGIFQATILGQFVEKICDTIHNLHEKRKLPTSEVSLPSSTTTPTLDAPPVTKSSKIKTLVKLIVKKLMKKFSYELLHEKIFSLERATASKSGSTMATEPIEGSSAKHALTGVMKQGLEHLLVNVKKLIEKEKAKRAEDDKKEKRDKSGPVDLVSTYTSNEKHAKTSNYNEVVDLLRESESEDEEANDAKSQKTAKTNRKEARQARKKQKEAAQVWLQEQDEETPLDLLDPMAIKSVLATKPLTKEQQEKRKLKELNAKSKNRGFKLSSDGKLLIDDSDEDDDDVKSKLSRKSNKNKDGGDIEDMMDTLSIGRKSTASKKKRSRDDDDSDNEENVDTKSKFSYKSGGTGIHRNLSAKKSVDYGAEYRAKKSRGDMKLKNKPDPYAYIPFNYDKLNKRKKAKFQDEFKSVVKTGKRNNNQQSERKKIKK